jgi:hypothetical protein
MEAIEGSKFHFGAIQVSFKIKGPYKEDAFFRAIQVISLYYI